VDPPPELLPLLEPEPLPELLLLPPTPLLPLLELLPLELPLLLPLPLPLLELELPPLLLPPELLDVPLTAGEELLPPPQALSASNAANSSVKDRTRSNVRPDQPTSASSPASQVLSGREDAGR